jgi:hypothetical protein
MLIRHAAVVRIAAADGKLAQRSDSQRLRLACACNYMAGAGMAAQCYRVVFRRVHPPRAVL